MKQKKQYLVATIAAGTLILLSACTSSAPYQTASMGGWDSLKYSDYTAREPIGLLRMGK